MLQAERVEVWFDEFTLTPGSSLTRSIDQGLAKSRYGLAVLSPSFFRKKWPQWELNGLVQRHLSGSRGVLLPIWHQVDHDTVAAYSPPLADVVAIRSEIGLDNVVNRVLLSIRPEGSTLVTARNLLLERGVDPPVVTDDWWLDIIEQNAHQDERRWFFPVWKLVSDSRSRGEWVAWSAMQYLWQDEVEQRGISQLSHPSEVLNFIESQPGLVEVCRKLPSYLLDHAPQLAIPGLGGFFEQVFDDLLARSEQLQRKARANRERFGSGLTTDGLCPLCEDNLALRHPTFGNYDPPHVACGFVQGNGAGLGPRTRAYDIIDYAVWFLSKKSSWPPEPQHGFLLQGMRDWAVWEWFEGQSSDSGYRPSSDTGSLGKQLFAASPGKRFVLRRKARSDLKSRLAHSKKLLALPETTDELVELFLDSGYIQAWIEERARRKAR